MCFPVLYNSLSVIGFTRVAVSSVGMFAAMGPSRQGILHVCTLYQLVLEPIGSSFPKESRNLTDSGFGCQVLE